MSNNELAAKIRRLRTSQGLTLEQVAEVVGVGKSTVRKWETGLIENMRRDKIAKLAKALHTTPGYLMGWEDSEFQIKLTEEQQKAILEALHKALAERNMNEGLVVTQTDIDPHFFLKLHKSYACLVNIDDLQTVATYLDLDGQIAEILQARVPSNILGQSDADREFILSVEEQELIRKYRRLDERGKSAVQSILEHEYAALPGDTPAARRQA